MDNEKIIKIAKKIISYKMLKITKEDFDNLPDELYSATPFFNYDSIVKNGLGIQVDYMESKKGFFLATDEDNARMYGNYEGEEVVVFVIQKSKLNKNKLFYDQNDCYTDDYVTLLKGWDYSWNNGDQDLDEYSAKQYWKKYYYNMCFFYDGVINFNDLKVL